MNVKQILTIFVISILMFFSGCNSLKRRIVVGQEKVGVEGEELGPDEHGERGDGDGGGEEDDDEEGGGGAGASALMGYCCCPAP